MHQIVEYSFSFFPLLFFFFGLVLSFFSLSPFFLATHVLTPPPPPFLFIFPNPHHTRTCPLTHIIFFFLFLLIDHTHSPSPISLFFLFLFSFLFKSQPTLTSLFPPFFFLSFFSLQVSTCFFPFGNSGSTYTFQVSLHILLFVFLWFLVCC